MKLLYCEACGDIIAPYREANNPRYCTCKMHAVWWKDPIKGILGVCDTTGRKTGDFAGYPIMARAYVLGITNALLQMDGQMNAEKVEQAIDAHPDYYLFKQWKSLIVRFRPGESSDTNWAPLPE